MSGQISIGNKNIEKCFLGEDKVAAVYYGDSLVYQGFIVEDKVPYNFRKSGGSAEIGNKEIDKVVGGTIVWNQLVKNGNFANTWVWNKNRCDLTVANNVGAFTCTSDQYATWGFYQRLNGVINHKYLVCCSVSTIATNQPIRILLSISNNEFQNVVGNRTIDNPTNNTWYEVSFIGTVNSTSPAAILTEHQSANDKVTVGDIIEAKNFVAFDLTQMFGTEIADLIYSLEQATAGAGVAFFKSLFPNDYYEYNAGELMSVNTSAHKMVGVNQWDEEWELGSISTSTGQPAAVSKQIRSKNFIPILPNTTYYGTIGTGGLYAWFYDANKNWISPNVNITNRTFVTPSNAHYMKIATYSPTIQTTQYRNDICINLSWSGYRNGEYEPYELHSYALDPVELRGIPKLDSNSNLYYDGDTYESDGKVTRKYGIVDLGSLNWAYSNTWYQASNAIRDAKATSIGSKFTRITIDSTETSFNAATSSSISQYGISGAGSIRVSQAGYSEMTADQFKTAMSGVMLVYELATPLEETATPYTNPQVVNRYGTEEYSDYGAEQGTRDVSIPVGHDTLYLSKIFS